MNRVVSFLLVVSITSVLNAQSLSRFIAQADSSEFVTLAQVFQGLTTPVDLAFYPLQQQRPNELWILNQGYVNSGGHTVLLHDATSENPDDEYIKDGNAWHFMAMSSAMAFGDDGNWATAQDIIDANRSGYNFTGPTLWPGDLSIYGIVGNPPSAAYNGSHLDMVHQTPYGKGIAHEKDNIYWVFDGYSSTVTRYDFKADHGPGQDYHGDAVVHRFDEIRVNRDPNLPSHMVMDKDNNWLYIVHTMGREIIRLDVTSGQRDRTLTKISNEPLADYASYTGASFETIVNQGLVKPVGIALDEEYLLVTDNATSEIIFYDRNNDFAEVGRIPLTHHPSPDVMGIEVGPDRNIYFVDYNNKLAIRLENNAIPTAIEQPEVISAKLRPNPAAQGVATLQFSAPITNGTLQVWDITGRLVATTAMQGASLITVDVSPFGKGLYLLEVTNNSGATLWTGKLLHTNN